LEKNKGRKNRDLWEGMSEDIWEIMRREKMGENRVKRLKALGNAIVPQIAFEIMKSIAWIENEKATD